MLKIKKRADIEREQQEREAEEQKLSAAKAQRQQEINKLKSGQLTLEQKVEVLWRLYLSDQGELELDAPSPGDGGKEGRL